PTKGVTKIDFMFATDFHGVGQLSQTPQAGIRGARGCEDDDGGEAVAEDFGAGIQRARTGNHHAQIEFSQTAAQSLLLETGAAGPELYGTEVHRAGAGHDGVGGGAQLEEMFLVAFGGEWDEMPGGRS